MIGQCLAQNFTILVISYAINGNALSFVVQIWNIFTVPAQYIPTELRVRRSNSYKIYRKILQTRILVKKKPM